MPETKRFISFNYNGLPSIVECKRDEPMKSICLKFCKKIGGNLEDYIFKYNNKEVDFNLSFNNQAKERDKRNCLMYIFVDKR